MRHRPFTAELQNRALRPMAEDRPAIEPDPAGGEGAAILDGLGRLERQMAVLSEGIEALKAAPAGTPPRQADETRRELAALTGRADGEPDRIEAAEQELAAIVEATETATQTILEATEDVDRVIGEVAAAADPVVAEQLAEAMDAITRIYQASTFQDITGQRIAKVVRTLSFIDTRLTALSALWSDGGEAAETAPANEAAGADSEADLPEGWDDSHLLNGPQLENEGISQAEIDKLFD
jgi:chemotaxis protein CheZ